MYAIQNYCINEQKVQSHASSITISSADADGPRDAPSVKILSTVETSCTTNPPQQIAVIELEGYN